MYKNSSDYNNNINAYNHNNNNSNSNSRYADYDNEDKKNIYIYLILLTICAIILVVYISYTLKINDLSYRIDQMQNELQVMEDKNHKLGIQLSNASSISQVDTLARSELNMVEPETMQTIVLKTEDVEIDSEPEQRYFLSQITDFITNMGTARAYSP
ncbi:MAG: cell division protein FtsL [Bacillota bacterium]